MLAGEFSGMGSSDGKITTLLIICCAIASTGGLVSGYCLTLTGPNGILSRDTFLNRFYTVAYRRRKMKKNSIHPYTNSGNYCLNDDFKEVKPFIYSFFLAAITTSFLASYTTRRLGRRHTMFIAGVFFIVGITLSSATQDLAVLFIGMVFLGGGVGFTCQAVPMYLSEMAPTKLRGSIHLIFNLNLTVGGLLVEIVSFGTKRIRGDKRDSRLLMGLAGICAVIFAIGSLFIVETPTSFIERGYLNKGKEVLRKIRHTNNNIEPEFLELVEASRVAKQVKYPFKNLLKKRNMPQLIIIVVFQSFCFFSGMNFLWFYVPVFLQIIGYDMKDVSYYASISTKSVNLVFNMVALLFVDKIGRRKLLLEAGLHMFLSHFLVAIIFQRKVKDDSSNLSHGLSTFVVILICTFHASYSWSWGALRWLLPSEIFPLEIRSAGMSVNGCFYFMFVLMVVVTSNPLLCNFKFGIFYFFSGSVIIMSFFLFFFLPETKNIPIEDMKERVWKRHWFWKRFLDD